MYFTFQNIIEDHLSYDNMDELQRNIRSDSILDQIIDEKCGSMSNQSYFDHTYMSCSFWMEGVLLFSTGIKY